MKPAMILLVALMFAGPLRGEDKSAMQRAGDVLQIALPVLALGCAVSEDRAADFLAGYLTTTLTTRGLKNLTNNTSLGLRPDGTGHGFPSGHTSSAFFGATSLARKCELRQEVAALAMAGAVLTGLSRIEADRHDLLQVVAGAALGYMANGVTLELTGRQVALGYSFSF